MEVEIKSAIAEALKKLELPPVDFVVEHPSDSSHGDYATNVALVAAKQAGRNPRELADDLVRYIVLNRPPQIERVEIAGPGFINFYLTRDFFTEKIATAREQGQHWGANSTQSGEEVLVEYTSPNLFKPLHVGNLVGNIIGESITRLFEASGATVRRLNYPSDIGPTVAKAVWGLKQTGGDPNDISALGEAYRLGNEAYETDEAKKAEIESVNQALYAGSDEVLNLLRDQGIVTSKYQLNTLCASLGTIFDAEIFESQAAPKGVEIVKNHIGDVFEESDNAIVYKGEKVGLHTRVFLNSKGLPTYEAKDVGNFVIKNELYPNWSRYIIVTGGEQTAYFKVLYSAIRDLFPKIKEKTLEHIPTGFLTLTTGKMSSREGNVLTGESLLEEMQAAAKVKAAETRADNVDELAEMIAVGALKYQIIRHSVGSNIVFDKAKALSFEGDSGPYLQYTHARICSVLEKAAASGVLPDTSSPPPTPYAVERLVYQLPEIVLKATVERSPHVLATYLTELASEFNSFYAQEKIADPTDEYAPYKAAVADAVRQTLENGLWGLGIKAPEKM